VFVAHGCNVLPSSLSLLPRPLWRGLTLIVLFNGLFAAWLLRPTSPVTIEVVDNLAQGAGPLLALPLCWGGSAGRGGAAGRR